VDRVIPAFISGAGEVSDFLNETRGLLKSAALILLPARERLIPKAGSPGKFRRHPVGDGQAGAGSPGAGTAAGVRGGLQARQLRPPSRPTCQDAIAEIHALGSRKYHWVFEADITACFNELSRSAPRRLGS
jgi:RNA-directed DNA polymerase